MGPDGLYESTRPVGLILKLPYTTSFLDPNEVRKICSMLDLDFRGLKKRIVMNGMG